jgi:hypothetical protein
MNRIIKRLVQTCIAVGLSLWLDPVFGQARATTIPNNEFGGQTIEQARDDFSIFSVFYDGDGNKVKETTVFTSDYPIDNNLTRLNVHFYFGKKTEEERVYSSSYSNRTLISRSIDHFDRNTGELIRTENHFIQPFTEYNVLYRENGKKKKIEWHYPDTIEGIEKNVSYLDDDERIVMTESFFTEKTAQERGFYKRIYYITYNINKYMGKSRQEWFYTDEYAKKNNGVIKKVELFHYALGKPVSNETILYGQNNQLIDRIK